MLPLSGSQGRSCRPRQPLSLTTGASPHAYASFSSACPAPTQAGPPPRAAAAAGIVIAAVAACGSSSGGSTAAGTADAAAGAGASGTLNWEWELPTSWDPVTSSAGWDMHALGLVYASITTLDPKGTVEAGLASSWQYAANGKSVTFQLRPG